MTAASLACVLFDLDGTLLDTAPDMARALNRLRQEHDLPALPFADIRPVVSHGSPALIELGFALAPDDPAAAPLRQRFLDLYAPASVVDTTLFAGMEAVLDHLEAQNMLWGVVTNKPGWLTEPIIKALALWQRAACVVSGDTTPRRKPDPDSLLHACRLLDLTPAQCVYIGDAERDIQAGKRAGMRTLAVRFGYLHPAEDPTCWQADEVIDTPAELLAWLSETALLSPPAL